MPINLSSTAESQRFRLLSALERGPMSTVELRRNLDILAPAARIKELRNLGYRIITIRENWKNGPNYHRGVARYVLIGSPT